MICGSFGDMKISGKIIQLRRIFLSCKLLVNSYSQVSMLEKFERS